jgi:vancomycin resistance protein YoaR
MSAFRWTAALPAVVLTLAPTLVLAAPKNGADKLAQPIRLTDGKTTVTRTRRELGFSLASKSPVAFKVDKGALKDALSRIAPKFRHEAENAKPYAYNGKVRIDPGSYARALNVPTTAEKIYQAVSQDAAATKFTVSLDKKPPVLTAARLKGVDGRLSSYATTAADNENRNVNVSLAVQAIDGTLLSPGETFSLNETVGRRSREKGYQATTVFIDRKKAKDLGGGVSQVTGTLFNAAALAGLRIDEVNPHSRPVSYIPVGRDATVAYGAKDLKFTNNTGAPVYIAYSFDGDRLRATFYGKKVPGNVVALRPVVKRLGPGKVDASLYRTVKKDGKVVAKARLFSHQYRWKPGT